MSTSLFPQQPRRLVLATILGLAILTTLSACGPSTSPLTLELRTADTHAPIADVAVAADSLAMGPSLAVSDIVNELMGRRVAYSSRGTTDARGVADLDRIPDRAVRVTVLQAGTAPRIIFLESGRADVWTCLTQMSDRDPVEIRILPEKAGEARR